MDGFQEMTPPEMDRQNLAGNHIILECGGVWVLLGHLQRGSVGVAEGEPIARGQLLARVGNTGNTGEPHLHIHAQRPGTAEPRSRVTPCMLSLVAATRHETHGS